MVVTLAVTVPARAEQFQAPPELVGPTPQPRVVIHRVSPATAERLIKREPAYVVEVRPAGPMEVTVQQKPLWRRVGESSLVIIGANIVAGVVGAAVGVPIW